MLSKLIKRIAQNAMLSASPDAIQVEMNQAKPEDLDFQGLPSDGKTPSQRADAILSAMTLDEKLKFVTGYKSLGIHALPRHGLPSVWMTDATSGPRCYGATTAFPSAVAMAASWDTELVAEAADHIAEASRAKGVSILLGPGINIARIPTCGRNFEYMGEDPFLAGKLASAYVRACARRGVICTVKHMAVNNSEYDRHKISSDLDERTLRELYLPAFEITVKEGQTIGIMSAYNPVNGVWASENRKLLTEILREEWGFDGMVVSDWNSLYSTAGPLKSGLDIEMPKAKWLKPERVQKAFDAATAEPPREADSATEADLDRMVGHLLKTLFAAGVYDRPVVDSEAREFHPDHDGAALKAARAGIVLLKNDEGALPLPQGQGITIALCGPLAEKSSTLGGGSCHVARTTGTVNLMEGLESVADEGTRIILVGPGDKKTISEADAVVVACGFNYMSESELYDRPWRLPRSQRKLIAEVSRLNSRTIVTLSSGGGVETESWISGVPALVHGLYLGQSVGTATAEILFGKINPSGKLPFTMARKWTDIPALGGYPRRYWTTSPGRLAAGQGNPRFRRVRHWLYKEGLMVGYRHFDSAGVEPAFPFGHGLSYSKFRIENLEFSKRSVSPGDNLDLKVSIKNVGDRQGSEVVQIYVADVESELPRPAKELKGFAKVNLKPGESAIVDIRLEPRAFQYWQPAQSEKSEGGWKADPGEFHIMAGRSSRNIEAKETIILR